MLIKISRVQHWPDAIFPANPLSIFYYTVKTSINIAVAIENILVYLINYLLPFFGRLDSLLLCQIIHLPALCQIG